MMAAPPRPARLAHLLARAALTSRSTGVACRPAAAIWRTPPSPQQQQQKQLLSALVHRRGVGSNASGPAAASADDAGGGGAAAGSDGGAPKAARERTGPLFCKKNANTGVLAGAVAKRIRAEEGCEIYAVGAVPCQNAIKAITLATKYLEAEAWLQGRELALTVEKKVLPHSIAPGSTRREETAVMCLHVRPLPAPLKEDPEVFVSAKSNPGNVAGLLRTLLQDRGSGSMSVMGPHALSQGLKTLLITEIYLKDMLDGRTVAATPRLEQFDDGKDEKRRIVLSCTLAPALAPVASAGMKSEGVAE